MRYLYCPKCGTKLIGKAAGDDGDVLFGKKKKRTVSGSVKENMR